MDHRINIMEICTDGSVGWFCYCNENYETLERLINHIQKEVANQSKRLTEDLIIIQEQLR
jgi:hypothetical protein